MLPVMIDIETMSRRPDAALVAIGAAKFRPEGFDMVDVFYQNVDLADCQNLGLHIEAETVMWWMAQKDEARAALTKKPPIALYGALTLLYEWLDKDVEAVWANGADFDNVILANAYRACGLPCPWRYSASRCFRTVRAEFGLTVEAPQDEGVAHNALDDAVWQAKYLQLMAQANKLKLV